ncbi:3-methyl-2-oxobutanoate hydroxymethyltransferase [Pseudomonas sp. GX19020]|uniref:3-methyl-2-oxobutanoate hydroxymethyltransferase n=1 Tax=Pseudomonas sp. GX19020 TaxID=2942277 RepID=UPI002019DFAB|nr:3-methyl-2-oxobutanoate hydroxymethyltransferase [Pseudomonas sp. GX19020]MCL4069220.1 3-methyl-2-oxobutanoate hydroxymethyltransferase [Pseudomonas sp. GX19020]
MPKIFDWAAQPAERMVTVGSLRAGKGTPARHAQVTADTAEEAAAAEAAGIEMVVCRAANVTTVRRGSKRVFVTAALGFAEAITEDEILRTAFRALTDGADAVITARRLSIVSLLAAEDIPVMGHLGFVPRKSTWTGRTRGVGREPGEAEELWHRFRRLEDAGAFAVEAELVAAPLLAAITRKSGLVTVSLGSGPGGDVAFLFTSDIIGDSPRLPRHARSWGDVASLRQQIVTERQRALTAFRSEVAGGSYPAPGELIHPESDPELDALLDRLSNAR